MKICEICGAEFEPRSNNQKYCSKRCYTRYNHQQIVSWRHRNGTHEAPKMCSLDRMNGDELLHYGAMQKDRYLEAMKRNAKR